MTVAAVLWDFGGVLTSSPFEAFNRYEQEQGIPLDFIRGINAVNPTTNAWANFESNAISLDEFDSAFEAESRAVGHPIPGRELIALLGGAVRPRMVEVLKRCKASYKVACITNNVQAGKGPTMAKSPELAAQVAEVMTLFECVVESSKEGIRKPNPRIYELACEKLEIVPDQAVYLDDLGINLKPAKAMGMQTIKVVSEAQAIAELGEILDIEF
jgi:putative hydrolase of the HAD superfamily